MNLPNPTDFTQSNWFYQFYWPSLILSAVFNPKFVFYIYKKSLANIQKIQAKHLEDIIDWTTDLESFETIFNIITKLEASENETDRIRSGLDQIKIMKMDTKNN